MLKEPSTLFGQYARLQLQAVSRLLSIFVLLFFLSLVLLALFRMFTGISIKRFGYLAICSVSFQTKSGFHYHIGRIGLNVHRPTVARPGWFEIVVKNCEIKQFKEDAGSTRYDRSQKKSEKQRSASHFSELFEKELKSIPLLPESQVWLRRIVKWLIPTLKVVNVSFGSLLFQAKGANYVVSTVSFQLDLRNLQPLRNSSFVGTLDAYQLKPTEIRAAFKLTVSEFFVAESLDDEDPHPILDNFSFSTTGVLDKKSLELKELTFSVSVHNMHIMLERLFHVISQNTSQREKSSGSMALSRSQQLQLVKMGVAIVYLVKEIDIKFNSFEMTKIPPPSQVLDKNGNPVFLILSLTDMSLNIRRMNPHSPGFKLLYSDSPAAHQAFLKVSSINFGVDANGLQEELLYVPLISFMFQTNSASNTLSYVQDENAETNNSIINGAFNVNSPTINIETHHLPILLQLMHKPSSNKESSKSNTGLMGLRIPPKVQNALPRVDISLHVSEAALRIVFDGKENPNSMFITSCSRIHSQLQGSHTTVDNEPVYSVEQDFEIIKGLVWYTSDLVPRFIISSSELIHLNMNAVSQPQLTVDISMTLSNINHTLTRYEIFHAMRCLVEAIRPSIKPKPVTDEYRLSPLRKLPPWLRSFNFDAKKLKFVLASEKFRGQTSDLAGVQTKISSFQVEYDVGKQCNSTDGRKVLIKLDDLALSSLNTMHIDKPHPCEKTLVTKPWLKLPSLECVLKTTTIEDIPRVTAIVKLPKLHVDFSMNVFLSVSVVREVLDHAYGRDLLPPKNKQYQPRSEKIEVKTELDYACLKAYLPNNEDIMITVVEGILEYFPSGSPRFTSQGIKLYSLHPFNSRAWCVIMSLVKPDACFIPNASGDDDQISIAVDGFRANVPFQFKLYRIVDNTITFIKAIRTLVKQTKATDPLYIIPPHEAPTSPKIPRVGVKAKYLALTLEDDPFESDISLIIQAQRHEMEARIHKEVLFEKEVKALLRKEGMELIDSYAAEISSQLLERASASTEPGDNNGTKHDHCGLDIKNGLKHAFTDQFMCRSCKHNGKRKVNKPNSREKTCLFCKYSSKANSIRRTITSHDSQYDAKSIAKDLKQKVEKLISSPMDLLACQNTPSELSNGWSDLWLSPEFYPWRQLHMSLDCLESKGVLNQDKKGEERTVTLMEARKRLLDNQSQSWIRTITDAKNAQTAGVKKTAEVYCPDSFDEQTCSDELVVGYSQRPLLFKAQFSDIYWKLSRSKFDNIDKLREFIRDVGKGVPMDQKYSIFVPLYFDITAKGGFDLRLRDYPLPVLNFPPLSAMQDPRTGPALRIHGNFIITEQLSHSKAQIRPLFVPLFPDTPNRLYSTEKTPSWAVLEVHRTLAPSKMFTDLKFVTNSDLPTRFTWCSAYKPAFQSMQNGFTQFSKPPIDISPVMGFWDKIRLILHARFNFDLKKSSLFFLFKGGRDPYSLIRGGAGFAFVWERNVTVDINKEDNPQKLFLVKADVFRVLIPDYATWERDALSRLPGERAFPSRPDLKAATSKSNSKVVMKFSNSTEWSMGMSFERKVDEDKKKTSHIMERTSEFRPHWDVQLSMPDLVENKDSYDAYHGFRSDYVYLAINVLSLESMGEPGGWNAVHLTPLVLRHFNYWKDQFKNSLWPPTRSGSLFPGETPKKTKLGTVLSMQQYQLVLEPLYISFTSRHLSHSRKNQMIAGVKARIDRFVLDLHTRKEPVKSMKHWATKLFDGEVSATHAEIKVLNAVTHDYTVRRARRMRSDSDINSLFSSNASSGDTSGKAKSNSGSSRVNSVSSPSTTRATHTDWIDYDDFTDILVAIPLNERPKVHLEPFIYSSHIDYVKKTDRSGTDIGEINGKEYLKFGKEIIHDCLIKEDDPAVGHRRMLQARKKYLEEVLEDQSASLESIEKELASYPQNKALQDAFSNINEAVDVCQVSIDTVNRVISLMNNKDEKARFFELTKGDRAGIFRNDGALDSFLNLLTIHSINVKWNDDVRDLVIRLKVLFSLHKEAVYTRSRRALKYLEDLVEELERRTKENEVLDSDEVKQCMRNIVEKNGQDSNVAKKLEEEESGQDQHQDRKSHSTGSASTKRDSQDSSAHKAEDNQITADDSLRDFKKNLRKVEEHESAENNMLVRFAMPQIQVLSNKNPTKCIQITARAIDLRIVKVFDVYEEDCDFDASEIESRFGVVMDEGNVFVFTKEDMSRRAISNLVSADYISDSVTPPVGSVPWPPWLGVEFCLDPGVLRRFLLAPKLDLCARYIRLNEQHVTSGGANITGSSGSSTAVSSSGADDISEVNSMRHKHCRYSQLIVDMPSISVQCDSVQYYTAYTIFKDLLHYTDPMIEESDKAIERIALGIDIESDYRLSLKQVQTLQNNLNMINRLIDNIAGCRYHNRDVVDKDLLKLELEFRRASMDLIITMRAFKAALRRSNKTDTANILYTTINCDEILATTLNDHGKPFMELSVLKAGFRNFKRGEQFAHTGVSLGLLQAWNLLPDAFYPDIIGPHGHFDKNTPFITAKWTTLDPVGGIPIYENIEVDVCPSRVQLERNLYDALHSFIVPDEEKSDENDNNKNHPRSSFDQPSSSLIEQNIEDSDNSSNDTDSSSVNEEKNGTAIKKRILPLSIAKQVSKIVRRPNKDAKKINEIVNRAAKYMTITKFSLSKTVVVASYKGADQTNLLDVQDIEIEIPDLLYQSKLWTKSDFFNRLKKDIIKVVLANSGQILGNMLTRHHTAKRHVSGRITHNTTLERIDSHTSAFSNLSGEMINKLKTRASSQQAISPIEWSKSDAASPNVTGSQLMVHPEHREIDGDSTADDSTAGSESSPRKRKTNSFFGRSIHSTTSKGKDLLEKVKKL